MIFTSKRVKYAIFTAISCPRASKISGFRPPASFWQVTLGVRKLKLCAVQFYTWFFDDVCHLEASVAFRIEYEDEDANKIWMKYARNMNEIRMKYEQNPDKII